MLQANATREDYDETLRLAAAGGFLPDPYVVNARGNVRASMDDWAGVGLCRLNSFDPWPITYSLSNP